ncbi:MULTISPECIES: M24 family metallopeptidase [Anaerotruncus]|nr:MULTISPECIES: M24 family metallopeptidase [Anaerotruncus]MCI8492591.1 M24 family metallopeptidase [Anaerotruncus sp.]MCR2024577.1 M24 family metallopeptidase [Anaerotruncus colihominis]NDO39937.1 M24 family metallopeptidase [Anaerotruncus colihominis]
MQRELEEKLARVRGFLEAQGCGAALFTTNDNFGWISCGRSAYVDQGTGSAVAKVIVTMDKLYAACCSSEQYRIMEEELTGGGFELVDYRWHEDEAQRIGELLAGRRTVSDSGAFGTENRAADLQRLRYRLTPEEAARYREIGPEAAGIVERCCREIRLGESEREIAGRASAALTAAGYLLPVCLVAADERLTRYRHPIPKDVRVERCAMLAVCAQKYGLTVSLSRIVSFGPPDSDRSRRYEALLRIDAGYIRDTVSGARAGDIVRRGRIAYEEAGYGEDFHLHHQGGALGYATRDYCAGETCVETVQPCQAFSWNPTIAGVKLEDTYLIEGDRREIITQTGSWPLREVILDGVSIKRPLILEL